MENRHPEADQAPITESVIRSLNKILLSEDPHIIQALAVVQETFERFDQSSSGSQSMLERTTQLLYTF